MDIKKQLISIPNTPGIYLFYNSKKELIYVGKASSLKNRVRSYFRGSKSSRPIEQLIDEVKTIKWRETDSIIESAILEGIYIKKYVPKYNIDWKDDKSWNYIVITKDEYPRVETLREHELKKIVEADKIYKYIFGPYPGINTKAMLRILQRLFKISFCKPSSKRPCFYRQMNECLGVCSQEISPVDYRKKVITPLAMFLSGRKKTLLKTIEKEMKISAKQEDFEEAIRLRNCLVSLNKIQDASMLNESFIKNLPILNSSTKNLFENWKPIKIEGYDISNFGSSSKVGSMVVFDNAGPVFKDYRKFSIREVIGQSDVDCLAEVLERRLKHSEWSLPDLFLIDGGVPQVNRIKKILLKNSIKIPIVGIAKGPARKKNEFIVTTKNKIVLNWILKNKKLLIQVRDEAHRFAILFHRKKRAKNFLKKKM